MACNTYAYSYLHKQPHRGLKKGKVIMKITERIGEFFKGFFYENRCPNCNVSFFKNGEGGLTTRTYVGDENYEESVSFCLKCLDANPSVLNKEKILVELKKRKYGPEVIADITRCIDEYLCGKISHDVWREMR